MTNVLGLVTSGCLGFEGESDVLGADGEEGGVICLHLGVFVVLQETC